MHYCRLHLIISAIFISTVACADYNLTGKWERHVYSELSHKEVKSIIHVEGSDIGQHIYSSSNKPITIINQHGNFFTLNYEFIPHKKTPRGTDSLGKTKEPGKVFTRHNMCVISSNQKNILCTSGKGEHNKTRIGLILDNNHIELMGIQNGDLVQYILFERQ